MVERVARAICLSRQSCEWCRDRCLAKEDVLRKSPQWIKAVAAIAAMREPTEAMMAVQDRVTYLRDMWPAMVDAALADG